MSGTFRSTAGCRRDAVIEAVAVADAVRYLADFCQAFIFLPWDMRPAALKNAVNHLVVLWLADQVRGEIFVRDVAGAAGVPPSVLRREIKNRCAFWENFNSFAASRRDETVGAICRLIFS